MPEDTKRLALTLLRFRELYIVVANYSLCDDDQQADFLFHSHQCTENMLRSTVAVFCPEQGSDPHAVLRYCAQIEDTPFNRSIIDQSDLEELLYTFKSDGQPKPSSWPEESHGMLPGLADARRAARTKGDS